MSKMAGSSACMPECPTTPPFISIRGTKGVHVVDGSSFQPVTGFTPEPSKTCRLSTWSPDGKYFAWANGSHVKVVNTSDWSSVAQFEKPKTQAIQFSPKGTYLATWEAYYVSQDNPVNTPNLHIWDLNSKQSVKSYVMKSQTRWEPAWSLDEKLIARNINQELQVYEVAKMQSISKKMSDAKVSDFSLSPSWSAPYHFLCYMQGTKGQPSFAKLFRYPNLSQAGLVATKSFFQGDRAEMKWNKPGNCVLLMTSTDVDTSGASYYGKQALHYLDTKGNTAMVQLPKDGPIYSVEWNPRGNEFCVVYGFMPAKATLFDLKCEAKFDFGTGARNFCSYNASFGNLLLLGGFGNLRGKMEVWDVQTYKLVSSMDAPDSTHVQWNPDGQHIMTSTTAPRLRVGNGIKVWHYSGSLIHEWNVEKAEELWEANWQIKPQGSFKEFKISAKKVAGITPSQPQVSKELYRPPGARGTSAILKCLEEREAPSLPQSRIALLNEVAVNKTSKNKKKKEGKTKKPAEPSSTAHVSVSQTAAAVDTPFVSSIALTLTGDEAVDKKLKDLKKKLDQIARMKVEQAAGKKLQQSQLDKIQRENDLQSQLEKLSMNAP